MTLKLYFLAILPPEDILEQIKVFKKEMAKKFGSKHALKLPAHLTLISPFRFAEVKEKELLSNLEVFADGQAPFNLKLNNFGCFPPRVIYVAIENKEQVTKFQECLREYLNSTFSIGDKDYPYHPHITIATRDLQSGVFHEAFDHFKDQEYDASFKVRNLSLMKHNGKTWGNIAEFNFKKS